MTQNTNAQNKATTIIANRLRMRQNIINVLKIKNLPKQTDQVNTAESISKGSKLKYRLSIIDSFQDQKGMMTEANQKVTYQEFQKIYDLNNKIGQGAHSTVYKCTELQTKKLYAVKITRHSDIQSVQNLKNQFSIMKKLDHCFILKAKQFFVDEIAMKTFLVSQYCSYKDLRACMQNSKTSVEQISKIIKQLCSAIEYLHSKGVCHRDIKPENILWNSQAEQIKLIDFDICKVKKEGSEQYQMWTNTGTITYKAPESFSGNYTQKIDLWSVGVIAFQLLVGRLPFQCEYERQLINKICNQSINFEALQICKQGKSLIKKLLNKDPNMRISAAQVQGEQFLFKF